MWTVIFYHKQNKRYQAYPTVYKRQKLAINLVNKLAEANIKAFWHYIDPNPDSWMRK